MAHILLVEDDPICRDLERHVCESDSHYVLSLGSAEEAVGLLEEKEGRAARPDLVIVDFTLKGMNGYELVRELRKKKGLRKVPILMVSATTKEIKDLLVYEDVNFLEKPFTNADLLSTIRALLAGRKPERQSDPAKMALEIPLSMSAVKAATDAAEAGPSPDAADPPAVEAGVTTFLDQIILKALDQRASDIHFEPQRDFLRVRTRIDGVLQPLGKLPSQLVEKLSARVKILCSLDITEKRLPQDGQFSVRKPDGHTAKFRVSTLPSAYGEKIVMRILPPESLELKLDNLGFSPRNTTVIQAALGQPNGLILATGPTGSGKTTALYSMLETLNSPQRNIVTVEDPVEYQLEGITQVQVNAPIGYTFERVLRSLLRQDPNIVLVGEIRDVETAEIALKASVTGHLVLSTLHTNDAPSSVHRLLSMGLPAYLVAAACRLVISQRLVRLLCRECSEEGALTVDQSCQLSPEEKSRLKRVRRPRKGGCQSCHGIGYKGRKAIGEVMSVSSHEMRRAIADELDPDALRELALKEGMVSMREEALRAIEDGSTSPEEALAALCL